MSAQSVTLLALALLAVAGATVAVTGWIHISRGRDDGAAGDEADVSPTQAHGADDGVGDDDRADPS